MAIIFSHDGEMELVGAVIRLAMNDYVDMKKKWGEVTEPVFRNDHEADIFRDGQSAESFLYEKNNLEEYIARFGVQSIVNADGVRRHVKKLLSI